MPYATTSTNSINHWNRLPTWVRAAISTLMRRVFASGDARARQQGWQVTSTRYGFGRQYRDPRFDTLTRCPACHGRGVQGREEAEVPWKRPPGRQAARPSII